MAEPKVFSQTKTTKKRYYARVNGSRFCHEDGTETYFFHGFADIDIREHQQEIDKIIGKNPNIYLPNALPEPLPLVPQNALSEVELATAERAQSGVLGKTAQEIGKIDATAGAPTDANASAVDLELQAAVFKNAPRVVGPGAANVIKPIAVEQVPVSPVASSIS
jgi:hypothetical protein